MNGKATPCPSCGGSGKANVVVQFFVYAFKLVLAANALGVGKIHIDADADFKWYATVHTKTGDCSVLVQEPAKGGRSWMSLSTQTGVSPSAGIDINNWAGTAQLPAYLFIPYLLAKQTDLLFNITDLSGAPNTVEIDLWGYKEFPAQG